MKYIVWYYAGGYDGYEDIPCDDWEMAQEKVKELCQRHNLKTEYKNWCLGKTNSIQYTDGKWGDKNVEIFITSEHLNKPI